MGNGGGEQGRAEITVSYLHHNMNDSAEKEHYLHFGNNYIIYTITLARYFSNNTIYDVVTSLEQESLQIESVSGDETGVSSPTHLPHSHFVW